MNKIDDLKRRIAQYVPVEVTTNLNNIPSFYKDVIKNLILASEMVDEIAWRQISNDGIVAKKQIESLPEPEKSLYLHYLNRNYSPYDMLADDETFFGIKNKPLGAGFYPEDLTKEEFYDYIEKHPDHKSNFLSPFSVIKRAGKELKAISYHKEYMAFVQPMAKYLKDAAGKSEYLPLRDYLLQKASDLLEDYYYKSDCLWIDLNGCEIDVVIGPYEVYKDKLAGIKTTYEAVIMLKNIEESKRLDLYIKYIDELDKNLPIDAKYKSVKSKVLTSPLSVVDSIHRSGDAVPGYQFVAFNLPNDPEVSSKKGTKKVLHKNFLELRLEKIIKPLAEKILNTDDVKNLSGQGLFNYILFHEISHGLGTKYVIGTQQSVNEALKENYTAIEECKADNVGMFCVEYLMNANVIPREMEKSQLSSYFGGMLRSIRFGEEAHSKASMITMNKLIEQKALIIESSGKYKLNYEKMKEVIKFIATEVLEIEAEGNYSKSCDLLNKYGKISSNLKEIIDNVRDLPIDFEPTYTIEW